MGLRGLAVAVALCAGVARGADTAPWPPPGDVEARMHALQQVIIARDSTLAQRDAARAELAGLLKSPAGRARGPLPGEKPVRAARAAIEPYPGVVAPVNIAPAPPPAAGTAQVDVTVPSKPVVILRSGAAAAPTGKFAIDPRTGDVLHETPGGYVDPRTGKFTPR